MVKRSIEWENTPEEGLVIKIRPGMGKMFTGETSRHVRAARKEFLMALESLIGGAIKRMEARERKTENIATKIEVK
jgi:hypothetical protein